ncbi:MAG: hypothetical protein E3J30_02340 [Anaerolineales bacterium]|nr:MAG: hypothetical protein E3J30_02340 [Anaerolineales bacterium]
MSIHIEEINVQDLGPIADLQIKFKLFNLVYGKNERGKTYLVEFILKSLFKSAAKWDLRALSPSGRVLVSGLEDDLTSFSPSSKPKIEDFWEEWKEGIPVNMAKLLVVKGAELSMVEGSPGGINKAIIKEYLSSEVILDAIQLKISKTVQDSSIENGTINGANRGEIKTRRELHDRLGVLDELFEEVDEVYSGGHRQSLNKELAEHEELFQALNKAKRYQAHKIYRQIQELMKGKISLSREQLESLKEDYREYRRNSEEISRKKEELGGLEDNRSHFEWLKNAIPVYEKRESSVHERAKNIFLILAALSLIGSILFGFFNQPIPATFFILLGSILVGFYIRQLMTQVERAVDIDEIRRISNEFEERFSKKLTNLPMMVTLKGEMEAGYYRSQSLVQEIEELQRKIHGLEIGIQEELNELSETVWEKAKWGDAIKELGIKLNNLEQQIHQRELELSNLDVEPSDYIEEDPGLNYEKSRLMDLEENLTRIRDEITFEVTKLGTLKQRICQETGDDISIEWEDLLHNLKMKRQEICRDYKQITSVILAKILVTKEINKIREQEDAQIRESLKSNVVTDPLYQITKRYHKIDLEDDLLIVSDPYNDFPLTDLSTGAQEQVLLALRIGFAQKIMGQDRAFLILDDAFQHADWERRRWLLEEVVNLAKQGWQIIYFTMDDHIRGLFEKEAKPEFGDQFHTMELVVDVT